MLWEAPPNTIPRSPVITTMGVYVPGSTGKPAAEPITSMIALNPERAPKIRRPGTDPFLRMFCRKLISVGVKGRSTIGLPWTTRPVGLLLMIVEKGSLLGPRIEVAKDLGQSEPAPWLPDGRGVTNQFSSPIRLNRESFPTRTLR